MAAKTNTYSTGRYGIIDLYYRHIWLNHWDPVIAQEVSKTFWSKATTVIFDLQWFDNYSDQTIDSTVSLNWKIPLCNDLKLKILNLSLKNPVLFTIQTEYESKLLINEPSYCNLTSQRQSDLQNQMLLMAAILENIKASLIGVSESMLADIRRIFLTEISTSIIYEKLHKLASSNINSCDDASAIILALLDKLYA